MIWRAAPWLDGAFLDSFRNLVVRNGVTDPLGMLGTWMSESGLRPTAHNVNGDAAGLFQAMPATLNALGVMGGWRQFCTMSAAAQCDVAERYYRSYRGKLDSGALCYLATFLPAYLRRPLSTLTPDFVICAAKDGPLPWAYAANAVFDINHDYKITIGELSAAIVRNARGPVWLEARDNVAEALGMTPPPLPAPEPIAMHDLGTTLGIQEALTSLRFDPGPLDGLPGASTRMALRAFQATRGLVADGIPGPLTRDALRAAMASA